MFTINGVERRNLEEQVLKNQADIERVWTTDRVLADFGIRVLGLLASASSLPETSEEYGDAYLVGEEEPYTVYIWTRANSTIGEDNPYWLNIGVLNHVGPQGPAGRSITNIALNNNYQLVFTFSDGTTLTLATSVRGPAGTNGVGVSNIIMDGNYQLTFYLSDGTSIHLPYTLKGADGRDGVDGESI